MRRTLVLCKPQGRYTLTPGPRVERRGRRRQLRWHLRWHLRAVDRVTPVIEILLGRLYCVVDEMASRTPQDWRVIEHRADHVDPELQRLLYGDAWMRGAK